jgi:hypothetical protein
MDLLEPTLTTSLPEMVPSTKRVKNCKREVFGGLLPETQTILAVSSATAVLRAARDETVVVAPPIPPEVPR